MTAGATTPARRRLGAEERRDQLVRACVEELAAKGFRATTADGIARRAGVSKGLLWHYFTDLDDLLQQTARRTVMIIARAIAAELDMEAPAPTVIRTAIHAAARIPITHRDERLAVNEIVVNLRTTDGTLRFTMADYAELHAAQEGIFRRGQTDGDIDPDLDPTVLAVSYQGAVDAMLGYLEAHPAVDPDTYADALADLLLDGMQRPTRAPRVDGGRATSARVPPAVNGLR